MFEIIPNWHPLWAHFAVAMLIVARSTLRSVAIAAAGALLTGYLANGSVARASEITSHDHAQPTAAETNEGAGGNTHVHAHAPTQSEVANYATGDTQHPASLLATRFGSAIAKGDVDTLRSLLEPDVLIFESGGVESSLAEYEQHHMTADMAFMKHMQVDMVSRQVFDLGESATVATQSRVHGTYQNREIDLKSTETLVMRSVNGQWKIIHIHWSSS